MQINCTCKQCIPSTPPALSFSTRVHDSACFQLLHATLTINEVQYTNVEDENCWEKEAAREEKENNMYVYIFFH